MNYFSLDERSYRVVPQVDRLYRLRPEQLRDYYVRGEGETLVPLSSFVTIQTQSQPRALSRFNQYGFLSRALGVAALWRSWNLFPGSALTRQLDCKRP